MSFKMPVGKELDDLLDQLTPKDIEQTRSGFEFDVQKEDLYRMINSNNYPSFEFSNEENMFIETQSSKLKQKSHINKNSNINIKTKSQIDSTENARAINLVNMNNIKTGMAA